MPVIVSDMDGTLSKVETWRGVQTWIEANHPSAAARRFVLRQMPFVLTAKAGLYDKEAFRARWLGAQAQLLRGLSDDGLTSMGRWVVEHHLWPERRTKAVEALQAAVADARARDAGIKVVIASGAYQAITDAFAERVGAEIAIGTPLEIQDGLATGRLAGVVQTGALKARAVRERIDNDSVLVAFGDTKADVPMLELARRAVAVAPDKGLRRAAIERGWEILESD